MVYTSDMISAQVGAFQQQSMAQMNYASMLSQNAAMGRSGSVGSQYASQFAGGMVNTAAAIGTPLMAAGMGVMGMDPFTRGLTGAWRGLQSGGLSGALGGGLMGAAPPLLAMQGAAFVGGNLMTGMQQHQQLQQQLGMGFRQFNSQGGRGFTNADTSQIGSFLRDMSSQRGPGGELMSMDELGRLASNMGRMGMAQGVKDAQDFKEKFGQMMKTVKTIAESFSTSLEEAQKIMSSMRGSGIFGNANQAAMAKSMRAAAAGGGVSMDQVANAANIGSQISRSIGGRGSAGARLGRDTISTVGAAQAAGVISEEDIYNATGLTGAEGQEAMSTQMMQINAKFFNSQRGRIVVAGMAGKDGNLDQEAMGRYARGEVGSHEALGIAQRGAANVGRANFIRNEGRLRGEAMAAMGPLGMANVARQWMQDRGMNLDNMNDRDMLFFQRQFGGLDRDQADILMKMARDLPKIQDQQRDKQKEDQIVTSLSKRNETVGLAGLKKKYEDAKHSVETAIQQVGDDMMTGLTDMAEGVFNALAGEYVRKIETGLASTHRAAVEGRGASADVKEKLGIAREVDAGALARKLGVARAKDDGSGISGDFEFTSEGARNEAFGRLFGGAQGPGGMVQVQGPNGIPIMVQQSASTGLDDKAVGKFLESGNQLALNTEIVSALDSGEKGSLDRTAGKLIDAYNATKDPTEREVLQRQLAVVRNKQGQKTRYSEEELKSAEQGTRAAVEAQDIREQQQAAAEFTDYFREYKSLTDEEIDKMGPMADYARTMRSGLAGLGSDTTRGAALGAMNSAQATMRTKLEDASDEELQQLASSGPASMRKMAQAELDQGKALKAAEKSGKKGALLQTSMRQLGFDLTEEQAKRLAESGKSGDELIGLLEQETGVKMDSLQGESREALKQTLGAAVKGKDAAAVDRAMDKGGMASDMQKLSVEQRKKEQEAKAAANDPSYRKLESMDKHLEKAVRVLSAINADTAKAANDKPGAEGQGGAPAQK